MANKFLGQYFLRNASIAKTIVDAIAPERGDRKRCRARRSVAATDTKKCGRYRRRCARRTAGAGRGAPINFTRRKIQDRGEYSVLSYGASSADRKRTKKQTGTMRVHGAKGGCGTDRRTAAEDEPPCGKRAILGEPQNNMRRMLIPPSFSSTPRAMLRTRTVTTPPCARSSHSRARPCSIMLRRRAETRNLPFARSKRSVWTPERGRKTFL